jgi:hypothetical protein
MLKAMRRPRLFWLLLILSFVLGCFALADLAHGGNRIPVLEAYGWLALFLVSVVVFRWKGLWLLLSAPFAVGPAVMIMVYVALCVPTKSCL